LITTPFNIVFAGTPDFSASLLASILSHADKSNAYKVSAVYCQPDRRVGRGKKVVFGPVKMLAAKLNIPIEQPIKFNQDLDNSGQTPAERLAAYKPDLMIVVAYGLILPENVLSIPQYGCINIHASLLPRWRGAAPIQRAIEHGDKTTGITIMQMDKGLDTGNMLSSHSCGISEQETGSTLHDRLAETGRRAIIGFLDSFSVSTGSSLSPGVQQNDQLASYAHKLVKSEAEIDWQQPAITIDRKIRAFNSWPVSFTHAGRNRLRVWQAVLSSATEADCDDEECTHNRNNKSVFPPGKVIDFGKDGVRVQCGDGQSILLTRLQADGSRAMSAADLLNSKSQWFSDNPILGH